MNKITTIRLLSYRYDLQQYDSAGERGYDTSVRYARGSVGGDSASPRAFEMFGNRERGDERQAESTTVGGRAPAGRDRDADLRSEFDLERRGYQ